MAKNCIAVFLGVLLAGAATVRAGLPATRPTDVQFADILKNLDDANPDISNGARARLMMFPLDVPEYEKILNAAETTERMKVQLEHALDLLKPGYEARLRWLGQLEAVERYRERTSVQTYLTNGHHDTRWDNFVVSGLRLAFEDGQTDEKRTREVALFDKAIAAGCSDINVRYNEIEARSRLPVGDEAVTKLVEDYVQIAREMMNSKYSPRLRANCALFAVAAKIRLMGGNSVCEVVADKRLVDLAVALLPEIAAEEDMPPYRVSEIAGTAQLDYEAIVGDSKKAFDLVQPSFESAQPGRANPLLRRGAFYINYAWEARGLGYANQVKAENWSGFGTRLDLAQAALARAYEIDPDDSRISTQMLTVALGQNDDRDEMEKWYARAIKANPDDLQAVASKLYYLEPKWHGSPREMVEFGRECLATENWYGGVPLELVDAHIRLSAYEPNKNDYFKLPGVWDDIQAVYTGALAADPDNVRHRTDYAIFACKCGHFDAALAQFKILGDKPDLMAAGGRETYDYWRRKAEKSANAG